MKRNAGGRDAVGKLESRFAALTGGLLARKGQAAPSNSPVVDPADETEAYSLSDAMISRKTPPKTPPQAQSEAKTQSQPRPETQSKAQKPSADEAPSKAPARAQASGPHEAPPAKATMPKAQREPEITEPALTPMKVINERSVEAGYPDNPSPEDIAALEAEADEVVSYFENFGSPDAAELEKSAFFENGDNSAKPAMQPQPDAEDDQDDEFDDGFDDQAGGDVAQGPWAGASVPSVSSGSEPIRAGVTVQLNAREFMRLSLAAAELGLSAQEIMADAIEEYLDGRGIESLGGCACLMKVQASSGAADSKSDDETDESAA